MVKQPKAATCCAPTDLTGATGKDAAGREARVFRALGDETRLQMLALIASRPEAICVCHIVEQFSLSQPTISHHLRLLREAGLVAVSRRGTWAYYAIDPEGLEAARSALSKLAPRRLAHAV